MNEGEAQRAQWSATSGERGDEVTELVSVLAKLGRTGFLAGLGRMPLTSGGRIERRDCYRQISKVAADICLRALDAAEWGGGPLGACSIPFSGQEVMDASLLRMEIRAVVRVLKSRHSWATVDVLPNWLVLAKGAADLSMHADRMALAATSIGENEACGGEGSI